MTAREIRNRKYLADLFAGPFPGHALLYEPPRPPSEGLGDFMVEDRPVADYVSWFVRDYENRIRAGEILDDDAVPYVNLNTNTGVFAAAFGCAYHVYNGMSTNAATRPLVRTAEEADRLREPDLGARTLDRFFKLARLIARELGPEVPISVPDIQSPFDIAALIWNKEELFVAMLEAPEAVKTLADKCLRLLLQFLQAFQREFPQANLCHCPYAWAPSTLGCWLSEDEVGAFNLEMFEEFCLPGLVELSRTFGGLFLHCCAQADHQYPGFARIPNLRMLNRRFQALGPQPCIDMFSSRAVVFAMAWTPEAQLHEMLDLARSDSRFLFNLNNMTLEEARPVYDRLRQRMPRLTAREYRGSR